MTDYVYFAGIIFSLANNEALLRRSLRERNYEPSNRDMLFHSENGTVPRRMARDYDSSIGTSRSAGLTSHVTSHTSYASQACHTGPRRWNEQQQFARSASARLPRTRHPAVDHEDEDYERSSTHDSRDGERKIQQVCFSLIIELISLRSFYKPCILIC